MHMRLAAGADDVRLNQDHTGYTMCMPIPGTYAQMQSNMAATLNIDWILQFAGGLLKGMGIEKSKNDCSPMWTAGFPRRTRLRFSSSPIFRSR